MQDDHANIASGDVTYRIEEQDLVAAHQLYDQTGLWSWQTMMTVGLAPLIVAAILANLRAGWPIVVCCSLTTFIGSVAFPRAMIRWYKPIVVRRQFRKQRRLHEEFRITWDAEGLRLKSLNIDAYTPWTHRRRWRDNAHVVLLYLSNRLFHFIPKRVLSQTQVASLRAHAAAAGVHGA